jgi:hypothetical protein
MVQGTLFNSIALSELESHLWEAANYFAWQLDRSQRLESLYHTAAFAPG